MILAKTYENQFEAWKYLTGRFLTPNYEFNYYGDYITYDGTIVSELKHPTTDLPDNPIFSKNFTENYCSQLVNGSTETGNSDEGFVYTYHDRLCNYNGIDQIDYIVNELKKSPESRRAVSVTWMPDKDEKIEDVPCMQWLKCVRVDTGDLNVDYLDMTVLFRSHDMFLGFPMNCCGLTALQHTIADKLCCAYGSLTVISTSAHVYRKRDTDSMRAFVTGNY